MSAATTLTLDTPRVLLNATNQVIWRWDSQASGDSYPSVTSTSDLPVVG